VDADSGETGPRFPAEEVDDSHVEMQTESTQTDATYQKKLDAFDKSIQVDENEYALAYPQKDMPITAEMLRQAIIDILAQGSHQQSLTRLRRNIESLFQLNSGTMDGRRDEIRQIAFEIQAAE